MNTATKLFRMGLHQVLRDGMLLILLPAPFLLAAALHYLLPLADTILQQRVNISIVPWFSLSDAFLIAMTPILTALVSAFLLLDERDEGIGIYYAVTPASGYPYLKARLGYPMLWALIVTILVYKLFGLTEISMFTVFLASVISTLQGTAVCMLLVAVAGNKVEGLALSKLVGFFSIGLPAAWFLDAQYKYFLAFLPSLWLGELLRTSLSSEVKLLYFMIGTLLALLWTIGFRRLFLRRTGL